MAAQPLEAPAVLKESSKELSNRHRMDTTRRPTNVAHDSGKTVKWEFANSSRQQEQIQAI